MSFVLHIWLAICGFVCTHTVDSVSHAGERGLVQRAEGTQQLKIQNYNNQKSNTKNNKRQRHKVHRTNEKSKWKSKSK